MLPRQMMSPALAVMVVLALHSAPLASEEKCLKDAWSKFNASDYDAAINNANSCIDNFAQDADELEMKLQKEHAPVIPPEQVSSEADKHKVFKQGLLNDVAAAYIVKAKAAEALAEKRFKSASEKAALKRKAIGAYEAACHYEHALVWDPGPPGSDHGWFWSPFKVASHRLAKLREEDGSKHPR
jgi:hypothetical protein